jgi:hypothetical protein
MAELAIKIDCGADKCMKCHLMVNRSLYSPYFCQLFCKELSGSPSGPYRLDECKKAEIKELR